MPSALCLTSVYAKNSNDSKGKEYSHLILQICTYGICGILTFILLPITCNHIHGKVILPGLYNDQMMFINYTFFKQNSVVFILKRREMYDKDDTIELFKVAGRTPQGL